MSTNSLFASLYGNTHKNNSSDGQRSNSMFVKQLSFATAKTSSIHDSGLMGVTNSDKNSL
jgi:hypothetical protein